MSPFLRWLVPPRYPWAAKVILLVIYAMWAYAIVVLIGDLA